MKTPDKTLDVLLWFKQNHKEHFDTLDMAVCAAYELKLLGEDLEIPDWITKLATRYYT